MFPIISGSYPKYIFSDCIPDIRPIQRFPNWNYLAWATDTSWPAPIPTFATAIGYAFINEAVYARE